MELIFELDGKCQRIDLAHIAIGPKTACREVSVCGRRCVEVSRPYVLEIPLCKHAPRLKKSYCVDVGRDAKVGDLHVCYEAIYDDRGNPDILCDDGFCMKGDTKEYGHYVLWNAETGELTVSEELDWQNVCLPLSAWPTRGL